jgi:hypothetical protein
MRRLPIEYEVMYGDAVFSIAQRFKFHLKHFCGVILLAYAMTLTPLYPEQILVIPPTMGSCMNGRRRPFGGCCQEFWASVDDILMWAGNKSGSDQS